MTTSVKIGRESKDRLERLRAEIKLETGEKVSQQELLDRIIEETFDSKGALIDSFRDDFDGVVDRLDPADLGRSGPLRYRPA